MELVNKHLKNYQEQDLDFKEKYVHKEETNTEHQKSKENYSKKNKRKFQN